MIRILITDDHQLVIDGIKLMLEEADDLQCVAEANSGVRALERLAEMPVDVSEADLLQRGEYLLNFMGCDDCHSPKTMTAQGPVPDMTRRLSGHPADLALPEIDPAQVAPGQWILFNGDLTASVGPWGISYAANLTPHETGIANWTFENFQTAITQGKHKGLENGRPLLPPMPWPAYRNMSEEDMRALFAALKNLPPVDNVVPAPVPPNEI